MKPINLDTEIVGSRYDPITRMCSYTVARDGRKWTVSVHSDDLNRHKQNRRNHLGHLLQQAMRGKADGE